MLAADKVDGAEDAISVEVVPEVRGDFRLMESFRSHYVSDIAAPAEEILEDEPVTKVLQLNRTEVVLNTESIANVMKTSGASSMERV